MKNLFVINTPFQLLSAFMVASSYEKNAQNFLLVLRPNEYKNWEQSTGIQYMLHDESTWEKIMIIERWLQRDDRKSGYRQQIKDMRERIESIHGIDRVFLGSDKIIQNQIMVEIAGCTTYSLLDEGSFSYNSPDRRILSKIWQYLRIQYFRYIGNIQGNMKYNFSGIGYGPGNTTDYLYRPELLGRKSQCTKKIEEKQIQSILQTITSSMKSILILTGQPSIIFLGSPFIEQGKFTIDTEMEVLSRIYQSAQQHELQLIYKTHHSENQDKLNNYQQAFPEMVILNCLEPAELLYHKYENIRYVISFASSGMLYINTFAGHIMPIAVYKLYGQAAIQTRIQRIFESSGVCIPENWEEVKEILSGLQSYNAETR
jgi:hypothetical protein